MNVALWINLMMAAFLSALLYVILKFFHRFGINNLHGLTFNYLTASAASLLLNSKGVQPVSDFFIPGSLIGLLFITVFYITALTTQKCGIAVTSIAGKMSMVIPVTAGIVLFHDELSQIKVAGMLIAVVAVYLSAVSPADDNAIKNKWIYPLLLFAGSGMVDSSIKIAQHYYFNDENFHTNISFIFACAGIIGGIIMTYDFFRKGMKPSLKSLFAGIILGITNYYSLYFLLKCLAIPGMESSLVFALVNLLVVIFSALFAFTLFSEKPAKTNVAGLVLAVVAILFLNDR